MSRVDYLTIGIVGVCLLALGFLVYKTVRLMGDGPSTEESVVDPSYQTDPSLSPDTYSYEYSDTTGGAKVSSDEDLDDNQMDYSENSGIANPKSDSKSKTAGESSAAKTKSNTTKERDVTSAPAEDDAEIKKPAAKPSSSSAKTTTASGADTDDADASSSGAYLVIAGTFSERANAEAMVKKLKKMGYDKAVVRPLGKYAVARVDRFDSRSDAEALEKELESKGIEDAYVRKKQ